MKNKSITDIIFDLECGVIDITNIERVFPNILKGIEILNRKTGASSNEELFAAWDCEYSKGVFTVHSVQPHWIKSKQKSFTWNGKKFV